MKNRLVLSRDTWARIKSHLFSDGAEHLCFIVTSHVATASANLFLEKQLVIIDDSELENGGRFGLELKLDSLIRVMNLANDCGGVLFEAHSHPFSSGRVDFSFIDVDGQEEMAAYIAETRPGRWYGALVLGEDAVLGQMWHGDAERPERLNEIRLVGATVCDISADGGKFDSAVPRSATSIDTTHDRQILAFGQEGQGKLKRARVAIVGLGGIGSLVAQQLAHLGVGEFVLFDGDSVEQSNLNRLAGATRDDIGQLKTEIAKRLVLRANASARVQAIPEFVGSSRAMDFLKGVDIIFGCVDTDSGRLILNEVANAYLIPYIDCGVGIETESGRIVEAGGRVVVWTAGRACLVCAKEINARIAGQELESTEIRGFRQQNGYVIGATVPEPAVISLNGTIASIAVTECLALVTEFRNSYHYNFYDVMEQRLVQRLVRPSPSCPACAIRGCGDSAGLERYERTRLPRDIPA